MPSEETGKHGYGADVPPVSTVFFGGGTPTMLRPSQLGELVGHVRDLWGLSPDAEVTTEANPETLDAQVLNGLLEGGVNRLSMGMQSADERVLALLDRHHTPQRAVHMARLAREVDTLARVRSQRIAPVFDADLVRIDIDQRGDRPGRSRAAVGLLASLDHHYGTDA